MAKLPRVLPNVFFDSKSTKGREFKKLFHRSQKHSLEGDFDTYFDTYFPVHYSIDSLSFITPEVMQAMISAQEYDIEINGDTLYLYSPVGPMVEQMDDMFHKVDKIRKYLLNNIITYRDQRLSYHEGRKKVSVVGFQLRKNLTKYYFGLTAGLLLLIAFTILAFRSETNVYLLIYGIALTASNSEVIRKEILRWRMLDSRNKIIS